MFVFIVVVLVLVFLSDCTWFAVVWLLVFGGWGLVFGGVCCFGWFVFGIDLLFW